jgi:hypothetical protein
LRTSQANAFAAAGDEDVLVAEVQVHVGFSDEIENSNLVD